MDYRKLHKDRRRFLSDNKEKDFTLINGKNYVLLSSPHGVYQTRLGKAKVPEIGSLATSLYLSRAKQTYFIAKTKNNFDDANFDMVSSYKDAIDVLATSGKIRYVLDFHGMAAFRDIDINLGTNFEQNTKEDKKLLDYLIKELKEKGFSVSCDTPFKSGGSTIAGYTKARHNNLWTLQIEINCKITNKKENFEKWQLLLTVFEKVLEKIIKES